MRQVLNILVIVSLGLLVGCGKRVEKDAFYYNSLIGGGVNLANALEAPKEGEWGVRLEEEYFDAIAKAGFKSVRIPVRWSAHASEKAPYFVDDKFFERIDWAINNALERDLAVVLNMHHYEELTRDAPRHRERFLVLWEQIAEHYKDYPDRLFFEILNEPGGTISTDVWNELLALAMKRMRKSNPDRIIVVGSGDWNRVSSLGVLRLPEDDRNIIVSFHYYDPLTFTHQGASWVGEESNLWLGTKWTGTELERRATMFHLDAAYGWGQREGRPIYMGEFGAYEKADMESRARWTSFVRREAEKRGMSWSYWGFCAGFGVYDKDKKKWRKELLTALTSGN
jgi:endoglucanase